MKVKKRG